jgi:hypothetical protein
MSPRAKPQPQPAPPTGGGRSFERHVVFWVGESVGLHPVWLIFALLAFGYLFGFVGLLVAVPLAATIGVLVRFALHRYRESSLYAGEPSA